MHKFMIKILNMTFRKDKSRIKNKVLLVFNVMRKIEIALFMQDDTKSDSMARTQKMAGLGQPFWNKG